MTATTMGLRELTVDEVDSVNGGVTWIVGAVLGAASLYVAANMYAMQRGAADHDANCTQH